MKCKLTDRQQKWIDRRMKNYELEVRDMEGHYMFEAFQKFMIEHQGEVIDPKHGHEVIDQMVKEMMNEDIEARRAYLEKYIDRLQPAR